MPYRLIYAGLALLAVAAVALGVVFAQEGDPVEVPYPIQSVSPSPGESVIRQAVLSVDLDIGYEARIFVDGLPIPDVDFVPATGVYTWAPHPNSAVFTEWSAGEHTVRVEWLRISGTPEGGSFEWRFRVH